MNVINVFHVFGKCVRKIEHPIFQEVKPHADEIHQLLKEWQQEANKWIQKSTEIHAYTTNCFSGRIDGAICCQSL